MARASSPKPWTRPADVREAVARRWPALLTAFLTGQEWAPIDVPLRGPGPAEIGGRLAEIQAWAAEWERAGRGPLRVEHKQVGGRLVGANRIPCRVCSPSSSTCSSTRRGSTPRHRTSRAASVSAANRSMYGSAA